MHESKRAWLGIVTQTIAWRYGIALFAFLISFFVRSLLNGWLIGISDRGLIIFLPAILLVTFFFGLGPALLNGLLSALPVWYFFLPPYHSFAVGINGAIVLGTFIIGTGVGMALVHWLRITIKAAEALATAHQQAQALVAADLRDMMLLNQLNNRLVRAGSDFDRNLDAVLDAAIAITGAVKGSLRLLDPTRGVLILATQRGFGEPYLNLFAVMPVEASMYAPAMKSGERVIIEDMRESDMLAGQRSKDVLLDAGVCSVTSTPLLASTGNLLGMVTTHFDRPHRLNERELHLIDLLARQAADYLETSRRN